MRNSGTTLTLSEWLDHISKVHPRSIELGLDRIKEVADALDLVKPATRVITVAGTNGKGSCVAYLESLLEAAGFSTCAYTSPHIHQFSERIRVRAVDVDDALICRAFVEIEAARGTTSLTYFEYATLAALWVFSQQPIDYALLEVGLGGRLDAVNMIDPDLAVITSISLDHQDWLGSDLEKIGFEKAGIMRSKVPTVYADYAMPLSIRARANELDSPLYVLGEEFDFKLTKQAQSNRMNWVGVTIAGEPATLEITDCGDLHPGSVAACIQTLNLLEVTLSAESLNYAVASVKHPGRFEKRVDIVSGQQMILDVGHNPAAAQLLSQRLQILRKEFPQTAKIIAVLAVLADKDIEGIVLSLQSSVDIWYIAQIDDQRALSLREAQTRLDIAFPELIFKPIETVLEACQAACLAADCGDTVVVVGSFHTVAIAREHSRAA
ncbi:MAG: dihydrofolate synthase/folylpolyglutamate synthase [Pseudohongiellaceae bacterium]|jgi:dihydrofolate synthase/folylpolyglutamate synthase